MGTHPLLGRLAAYRLEHDLSYDRLAAAMTQAGYPMKGRALHLVLTNRVRTAPHDRTLYKITQFLTGEDGRRPRKRPAKRRAA